MQIFNSGFFWFIEGILFVLVVMGLRSWARDRGLRVPKWKWGLFMIWLLFAGFTISFVGTSFGEGESVAGTRGGLLFGAITIIAGVGLWRVLLSGAEPDGGDAVSEA